MHTSAPAISVGQHSSAGRKDHNDDSYGVSIPQAPLLEFKGIAMAIADGMSSSEGAKAASETCVRNFLEDYYATPESWNVKKSAAVVLKAINNWLYAQGQAIHHSEQGMVSTFSVVVLKAGTAHVFHAGDSRISLLRDGMIEPLTRDHKVRTGGSQFYLARAIGINPNLEIDYKGEALQQGDVLLFTTDGVHDHVAGADMIRAIGDARGDLDAAAVQIVELALTHGSLDNLTCQIVRIDNVGHVDAASHLTALTQLPFPPELTPGMNFEGFSILRELHASKRTQVYLARDNETHASVVLKTPSVNFEDDAAYLEMFTREEWIGRLVSNPHVLNVIPASRPRKHLYYVTEYFEGDRKSVV